MLDDHADLVPLEYRRFAELIRGGGNIGPAIDELYEVWKGRYLLHGSTARTTVLEIEEGELLFDRADGVGGHAVPRTLGATAFLRPPSGARDTSYQAGFPLETHRFGRKLDRGHLIPHSGGGLFGPNIFPQDRRLNRGWSEDGKLYRAIESEAARSGAFFFCALRYCDDTDFPAIVELGTVQDCVFRVRAFRNRFDEAARSMFPKTDGETE